MSMLKVNLNDDYSWWEEHRGAIIFFSGIAVLLIFGFFPWIVGVARIIQWVV